MKILFLVTSVAYCNELKVLEEHGNGSPKTVIVSEFTTDISIKMMEYDDKGALLSEKSVISQENLLNNALVYHGSNLEFYLSGVVKSITPYCRGKIHGSIKLFYPNGNMHCVTSYKNGIKEGVGRLYYENGVLKEKGFYLENILNGPYELYCESGNKTEEREYEKGVLVGEAKVWYDEGYLKCLKKYLHGKLHGEYKQYYLNGNLEYSVEYFYGHKNGLEKFFFENSKLQGEGRFIKGTPVGKHFRKHENGQVAQVANFDSFGKLKESIVDYDSSGNKRSEYKVVNDEELKWLPGDILKRVYHYDSECGEMDSVSYKSRKKMT